MDERVLQLSARKEATRNKMTPQVVLFQISEIEQHYHDSVAAIQDMFGLVDALNARQNESQARDIMRAQIVFLVGALDFYMHEITKLGLDKIFHGEWEKTLKYSNINVPMDVLNDALNAGEDTEWFIEFVNKQFSTVTIVSYQNVKDQLNLLGLDIQKLADDIYYDINSHEKTSEKLKNMLNGLFRRRNIIAHQSDRSHINAEVFSIEKLMVTEYIHWINKVVEGISGQISEK